MLSLIVTLIIVAVVLWGASRILGVIDMPEPVRTILWVLLVVFVILWLMQSLFGTPVLPRWR